MPSSENQLPSYMTEFAHTNSFGIIDHNGEVILQNSDIAELEMLAGISDALGHYVFKRRCGRLGYLDENQNFVPVA